MNVLITPLGVLYIFAGVLSAVLAVFLFLYALFPALIGVVAINGVANGEEGAFGALVLMFGTSAAVGVFAVIAGALGLGYIADGIGLIARRPWARWAGIGLAVPLVFVCMPFGAVIGVLALITLLMPDAEPEFTLPSP